MDHPDVRIDFDRIERAKGVITIPQGNLEHTAINALERLRLLRLSARGGDGERVEHVVLNVLGEILKIPARGLDPGNISGVSHSCVLTYLSTPCKVPPQES